MGVSLVSWPDSANSEINDLFRDCVRAEMKAGPRNQDGAMSAVAAYVGVSPQLVKLRYFDHVTGRPRKKGIRERCWAFLDAVARKEREWADRIAAEVERQRAEVDLQLTLPLTGAEHDVDTRRQRIVAARHRVVESALESADRAAGDYARAKAERK